MTPDEQNAHLLQFNRVRAEHGVPALKWDDNLAKVGHRLCGVRLRSGSVAMQLLNPKAGKHYS